MFVEAVETVWPRTIGQTCVVHLLRNSFRYAARQDWDKVAKALTPVCSAPSEDAATERFLEFQEAWGGEYPAIVKLWSGAWAVFVPFLSFDVEIRKVICSTNAIGSLNARIRRAVSASGYLPDEAAALNVAGSSFVRGKDAAADRPGSHRSRSPPMPQRCRCTSPSAWTTGYTPWDAERWRSRPGCPQAPHTRDRPTESGRRRHRQPRTA
jgi:transposase-like protein